MAVRGGSTATLSVSLPVDVLGALKERAGARGVSAYVTEAVRHRLAMEGLDDIVRDHEETVGPVDEAMVHRLSRDVFGTDS
jgi:hypothetical protein